MSLLLPALLTAAVGGGVAHPISPSEVVIDSSILPPRYVCQRTAVPPKIDGKLDDPVWQKAMKTAPFVDIEANYPGKFRTPTDDVRTMMVWDDSYLYVGAWIPDQHLWGTKMRRDEIIYHDPDFEVFIDPSCTGRNYIEIEINALNTVWDLFLTAPYGDSHCVALHDWNIPKLKHAVHVVGTLNDPRDTDSGWSVEMAIPWESITGHSHLPRRGDPPSPGTVMRMNFSHVDWNVVPDTTHPSGYRKLLEPETNTVWAPTGVVNIHVPEHWGEVYFSNREVGTWEASPLKRNTVFLWVHGGDHADSPVLWKQRFRDYKSAGVDAVIIDGTVDSIAMLARHALVAELLPIAWVWSLNRPGDSEALTHSEWYAVNRDGKSCHRPKDRPYVEYYEFLCPNHPGVRDYLVQIAQNYAGIPGISGIQLDYIRMVDVILPRGLWEKYDLVMDKELPEFDYCYCVWCTSKFKKQYGRDIADDPTTDTEWREFRLQSVAEVATLFAETARNLRVQCVAAVFPTPSVASQLVRQDWRRFPIDLALPMDYNSFYNQPDSWIGQMTREAIVETDSRIPVAPGIHLPDISPEQLPVILNDIVRNGGSGIGLFSHETFTAERQDALRRWKEKRSKP